MQPKPASKKSGSLPILEKHIQKACEDLLELDGWRIFRIEQNFSEKKRKSTGERSAPDALCVRYRIPRGVSWVLFIEWKRFGKEATPAQKQWHRDERILGALTWMAGTDFPATIDGFIAHYRASGLNRGRV